MKVTCIGGGPAGLYFAILMKRAFPETEIRVIERNKADDTFGWGVVFSDETLSGFEQADPESFATIEESFRYWSDIHTYYADSMIASTGHGFCGLSRRRLLTILQERCLEVGVTLEFGREVKSLDELAGEDLVLAADGVNSSIREGLAEHFRPRIDWRKCKFCWLGTDKHLEAFTFIFKENEHGLFQVHAYPFEENLSTWIVECREEVWKRSGLDSASEEETVAYCSELFAEQLEGHSLLTNRSTWRTFPTITNERWHHGNVVLIGDAAHTAHFSIGSGTKLAMEDAIALVDAFSEHGTDGAIEKTLDAYHEARRVDVIKLQKSAQTSLEWFENSARYMGQPPARFQFNLMTRSKRITYDNLEMRDPELVAAARKEFCEDVGAPRQSDGRRPAPIFTPFDIGDVRLANRIVVSPMCQYSAVEGTVGDWHLVHLGSRAVGGAGLVITEMTDVLAEGRITTGCAGLYSDEHVTAWQRIVDFVHQTSPAKIGVQLAHAGRKGSCHHPWEGFDEPLTDGGWPLLAPSAVPFLPDWPVPRAMDREDMDAVCDAFVRAAERALEAGFDLVELHMAHGYLLSSFLSPLTNHRDDAYGGSLANRARYPLEVLAAVRAAWPAPRPLAVRISATDWHPDGFTPEEAVELAALLSEAGCDLVDVSSSGNSPDAQPIYGRMYQVPFAERIRAEVDIPVMAVGAILGADHANTILTAGRADLCAMARPHLRDAYLTLHAAEDYDYPDQYWPGQYILGKPAPRAE
ncbi:MAG: bifunctional salicylyl-CoA 5-hydroxylase/oxidoreductase [Planctomycetota bacterium]|nr:bifunctional salicylyl-CoA 5-hydroxylase/oxidoreductase [Planctomycetota bacterium]